MACERAQRLRLKSCNRKRVESGICVSALNVDVREEDLFSGTSLRENRARRMRT